MKKFYFRFGITILCIVIGLLSVLGFKVYQEVMRSLNNKQALINQDKGKPKIIEIPFGIDGEFMKVEIDENEPFTFLGHACGNGYVDGYITSEGERLSSGLEPIEPRQFRKEISKTELIEKVDNFENKEGNKGTRLVLKGKNSKSGKDLFEIDWYDNNEKKQFIVAPSLKLALEFESWQRTQK